MFSCNYHTHTKRCGHASGEDEEYVLQALGRGLKVLGFSDHAMLPGLVEPYKRGDYSLFDDYCDSINSLRKKYQDQITLYLGFEAESFEYYFNYYHELINNKVLDYLILGNHSILDKDKNIVFNFFHITTTSELYQYKELAIKAIETGLFSIFAHPDYFLASIPNFDYDCKKVSKELIEACIAYDIPLEINLAGIRYGEKIIGKKRRWIYPSYEFFSLVSKYKAKCIFGYDAHSPKDIGDTKSEYAAILFANKLHLNVIDELPKLTCK